MSGVPPAAQEAAKEAVKDTAKVLDNPALRMLGLPRLRAKLPSRNWLIFWTVLGGFSGTIWYDRRQKRIIQQKWCNAVSHLSQETLESTRMPRKLTVFLSAPPGDNLRPAREHFQEYIKPILVAAGADWDAVEGRKEGDIRAALAERIRKRRRKDAGEALEDDLDDIAEIRTAIGVQNADAPGGDLIFGRHTWKEYVRGLHEGWLGPMNAPPTESIEVSPQQNAPKEGSEATTESEKKKSPKKPSPTLPYIRPAEYGQSSVTIPEDFPNSTVLANAHMLGFLKTPIRIWRYLNQRDLAESEGRRTVDFLLSTTSQPYQRHDTWEQKTLQEDEEQYWHKSAREPNPEDQPDKERPWTEEMVIDDRIGSRMRRPEPATVDTTEKGHLVAWRGSAETNEPMSWLNWLKWSFDLPYEEPKCKGWEDGLKGNDVD